MFIKSPEYSYICFWISTLFQNSKVSCANIFSTSICQYLFCTCVHKGMCMQTFCYSGGRLLLSILQPYLYPWHLLCDFTLNDSIVNRSLFICNNQLFLHNKQQQNIQLACINVVIFTEPLVIEGQMTHTRLSRWLCSASVAVE